MTRIGAWLDRMNARHWAWLDDHWGWLVLFLVLPYWIVGAIRVLSWMGIGRPL